MYAFMHGNSYEHVFHANLLFMDKLNREQQIAVDTLDGPVLIIAGAGSGKTKVITHRMLNLIKHGTNPHNILAITFTNKAAREMRDRVNTLIASDRSLNRPISSSERPFVSTFHALGVHIIRSYAHDLGLKKHFSILDRSDSKRIVKSAMEKLGIDPKKFDPGFILNKISTLKGDGVTLDNFSSSISDQKKDFINSVTAQIWQEYEISMKREGSLDFDDLLAKSAGLLESNEDIRRHYGNTWKYIHIDEYQDTNRIQYKIAKLLISGQELNGQKTRNICAVGDADQNIYSWRGATIENILNFEKDYPEAKVVTLERNYRSTKIILSAANDVIKKNSLRKEKNLFTDNVDGEKISLLISYSENDEARAIADTARELIDAGTKPSEIAVLYRANFQSRAIEESFIKKNLPYQLLGTKFFERKEVKDVISYIRASFNRESWGDIARIINTPPRGIGKVTLAKLASGHHDFPSAMQVKIDSFWKLLDDVKKEIWKSKPSNVIRFIIKETGMENRMQNTDGDDEDRLLNVRELVSVASQYDDIVDEDSTPTEEGDMPYPIRTFLENVALSGDQDEMNESKDAVRLMTVHASKGLEFDAVIVAGLEQELFPFKHIDEENMSLSEREEERRLFYVAITRAKKKLCLSYAIIRNVYGREKVSEPSEFIADIDPALIDDTPRETVSGAKAIFIDF